MNKDKQALNWLLKKDQPSVRYLTLTELFGRAKKDPEVESTRKNIAEVGWAKQILDRQLPGGFWFHEKSLFNPTFHATFWMLLILSDLGLTKKEPRVARASQTGS